MSQALPSIQENAEEEFVTFANIASFVASHWRALLISVFAGGLLGYASSFLLSTKYTATARLLPPQQQGSGDGGARLAAGRTKRRSWLSGGRTQSVRHVGRVY